ncbi:MAG TPA: molybdenum cofactor guanylyltransferase [Terriglobales bacterium]|nr:molybdenum cofactor guanylyltransferase [Terriglobales bacterium]
MADLTAFILAGGQSSRMGRDKAFLPFNGRTLLEHAIALAKAVAEDVVLIGQRAKLDPYGVVTQDIFPGCGPLGGIHAALSCTQTDLNLILALDTPFVPPKFLAYEIDHARAALSAVVTYPRTSDQYQPLCAVYRKPFLLTAEAALQAGRYKIEPLLESVPACIIGDAELQRLSLSPAIFDNLNTPADWERACRNFGL